MVSHAQHRISHGDQSLKNSDLFYSDLFLCTRIELVFPSYDVPKKGDVDQARIMIPAASGVVFDIDFFSSVTMILSC